MWEALGDLPEPASGGSQADAIPPSYVGGADSELRRFYRSGGGGIFNHVARPLGRAGLEKVRSIVKGQAASDIPDELKPKASYHYSYARLRWSEPARTITKFCYHVGSPGFLLRACVRSSVDLSRSRVGMCPMPSMDVKSGAAGSSTLRYTLLLQGGADAHPPFDGRR